MPRPAYPTALELAQMLSDAGLGDCLPADLAAAADEAKSQWERDTDWGPFQFKGEASERAFDAPGPLRPLAGRGRVGGGTRMSLRAGLLSVESVFVDNVELQQGRDFFYEPTGSYDESGPVTTIRFLRPITSGIQGVRVKGDWGFCRQLPDDVYRAVALKALGNRRDIIARQWQSLTVEAQKSVLKAKESGPVRLEYASIAGDKLLSLNDTFAIWDTLYSRALVGRVMLQP